MILKRIQLHNFRNISSKVFDISPHLTIIVGENAKGKTNMLESIHCIINGVGFRESREEELLLFGEMDAQLDGMFDKNKTPYHFRILLRKDSFGKVLKHFFIQKVRKGSSVYRGEQTKSVLFAPEQIEIITASPDVRRGYFNALINTFDLAYKKHLVNYEQALRKRNKILEHAFDSKNITEELSFWNTYLVNEAEYITKKRTEYVEFLSAHPHLDGKDFSIEYIANEFTLKRLQEKKELELRVRRTLIGPQKDDWVITLKNKNAERKDIQKYGSRSEQRLGIFWLKMNEIHFIEEKIGVHPILLLDDVFSEFDHGNKERIIRLIENYQTVMTTTEEILVEDIEKKYKNSVILPI